MIIPVTPELKNDLLMCETFIERIKSEKVSDGTHYGSVVARLESLALALLAAGSAGSLLAPKTDGARLDIGPQTKLSSALSDATYYLGGTARNLLRHDDGALSPYIANHTDNALGHLKMLHNPVLSGVRRQAEEDLRDVRDRGVAALLTAADNLARYASPAQPETLEEAEDGPPVDDFS